MGCVVNNVSARELRKLRDGIIFDCALKIFGDYLTLLVWDVLGLIEIRDIEGERVVRLTSKGEKAVQGYYCMMFREFLNKMLKFDKNEGINLIKRICAGEIPSNFELDWSL